MGKEHRRRNREQLSLEERRTHPLREQHIGRPLRDRLDGAIGICGRSPPDDAVLARERFCAGAVGRLEPARDLVAGAGERRNHGGQVAVYSTGLTEAVHRHCNPHVVRPPAESQQLD